MTAAELGAELGTTRNAIISHMNRYADAFDGQKRRRAGERKGTDAVKKNTAAERRAEARQRAAEIRAAEKAERDELARVEKETRDRAMAHPAWKPLAGSKPRPLPDVSGRECCWPLWAADGEPKIYCGEFVGDDAALETSYCPTHMRKAYQARKAA